MSNPPSPPDLGKASDQAQHDLHLQLRQHSSSLGQALKLSEQLTHLRAMLTECLTSPVLTGRTASKAFDSRILGIIEEGMEEVTRELMHTLGKEWKNLQWVDKSYLQKQAEPLSGVERATAERCLENIEDLRKMQNNDSVSRADVLVRFLKREAQVLEEAKPVGIPKEWMFCFVLFLLVDLGKLVSTNFRGWEVRSMAQAVPGTAEHAECDRPHTG